MHALLAWLQKDWSNFVVWAVVIAVSARRQRRTQRTAREREARAWPALEGVAECWTRPAGWGRRDLFVRGVISDGQSAVCSRTLLADEARYYARALEGQTVAVHVNRWKKTEWILCWDELRSLIPEFVSPLGGRLTHSGFRAAQTFRGVAVGGFALAVADAGAFAAPAGRNFMWHDMCLCELSILLLLLGIFLLVPANGLRARMAMLPGPERTMAPVWRTGTVWLSAVAGGVWLAVIGFALLQRGGTPDAAFYGLLTAPVFPLLWWSMGVGMTAVEEMRPPEVNEAAQAATPGQRAESETALGVVAAHG